MQYCLSGVTAARRTVDPQVRVRHTYAKTPAKAWFISCFCICSVLRQNMWSANHLMRRLILMFLGCVFFFMSFTIAL